jgi:hypothetical protein
VGSFGDVALCEGSVLYGSVYVRKGKLEIVDSFMPAWRIIPLRGGLWRKSGEGHMFSTPVNAREVRPVPLSLTMG